MVGRNSSMLLMTFCMTPSNTHSSGRHSSSISLVDDGGKYLEKQKAEWARGACTLLPAAESTCTHGLQLLIRAFRMGSRELQISRGGAVNTCTSGRMCTSEPFHVRVRQGRQLPEESRNLPGKPNESQVLRFGVDDPLVDLVKRSPWQLEVVP